MWKSIRKSASAISGLCLLSVTALPASADGYRYRGGYWAPAHVSHKIVRISPAKHYRYYRPHFRPRAVGRTTIVTRHHHRGHRDSLIAAGIVGALVGVIVSRTIANSMDDNDHVQFVRTFEYGRTGQPVVWNNPTTGSRYTVTPTRTYQQPNGRYCREYTTWGWVGGYEEQLHGTVCRMPDGSWQKQG